MSSNNVPAPNTTVSIGDWIVTFILTGLPVIGFIMLIVWAFGADAPQSKKNWARATLILYIISVILVIIFYAVFFAVMLESGMFDQFM